MSLKDEIFEQPSVVQGWLETSLPAVREVAATIRARGCQSVVLAARGTSDHAGIYAQYLWGSRNRLSVALAAPSLFTMFPAAPHIEQALVVGISQSGQSPDIVAVVAEGRRQGALTLAITNDATSPLAEAAEFTLDIRAGQEQAVAATKTYTAELLVVAALSVVLAGESPTDRAALDALPAAMTAALQLDEAAAALASGHEAMNRCIVLGRGYHYATAREWALKLKELAYVLADSYSPADFQHGPIALVEPGFRVLALAPAGAVLADQIELLRRLRDDHGAELLVLSDDDSALALGAGALRLPAGVPEWLMPLVSIVPAQLYSYHLTRAKGLDAEQPRTIHKVTRTQ
ncbi:MAG TPA: SIS domain-containing protein [Chloroflexia bacterium]|nr:SIS domain-containing protein [Chloroflexia bacterium]